MTWALHIEYPVHGEEEKRSSYLKSVVLGLHLFSPDHRKAKRFHSQFDAKDYMVKHHITGVKPINLKSDK